MLNPISLPQAKMSSKHRRQDSEESHLRDKLWLQPTPLRGGQQQLRSPKHNVSRLLIQLRMPCSLSLHTAVMSSTRRHSTKVHGDRLTSEPVSARTISALTTISGFWKSNTCTVAHTQSSPSSSYVMRTADFSSTFDIWTPSRWLPLPPQLQTALSKRHHTRNAHWFSVATVALVG